MLLSEMFRIAPSEASERLGWVVIYQDRPLMRSEAPSRPSWSVFWSVVSGEAVNHAPARGLDSGVCSGAPAAGGVYSEGRRARPLGLPENVPFSKWEPQYLKYLIYIYIYIFLYDSFIMIVFYNNKLLKK